MPQERRLTHRHDAPARRGGLLLFLEGFGDLAIGRLLAIWLGMILTFGLLYWSVAGIGGSGLRTGSEPVMGDIDGLLTALYFSFVTALSIGYGDVIPTGFFRLFAVLEGSAGLLLFGIVISRLVSRRQEELTEEIHRITFEGRLERVRTNLHLVLSDLHAISTMCLEPGMRPERILSRTDSAATVFAGEMQAIHDLLYRPQQAPDEEVLESILAGLAMDLKELVELLSCLPATVARSSTLSANLRSIRALSNEICGECVPRDYAPELRDWMDRIQEQARLIA